MNDLPFGVYTLIGSSGKDRFKLSVIIFGITEYQSTKSFFKFMLYCGFFYGFTILKLNLASRIIFAPVLNFQSISHREITPTESVPFQKRHLCAEVNGKFLYNRLFAARIFYRLQRITFSKQFEEFSLLYR